MKLLFPLTLLAALFAVGVLQLNRSGPLYLMPLIGGLENCILPATPSQSSTGCVGSRDSAADLIESTLQTLGPSRSNDGSIQVGYALTIPLLKLFRQNSSGTWHIDQQAVTRVAQTIRDQPRPVVLYLFSTHFGVDAPIEEHLAQSSDNLAWTQSGPLPKDKYYNLSIYPWSVARTDNELTTRRRQAIQAVLSQVCQLPAPNISKVKAVTLLGEVHHLYPGFESGMGFDSPYQVTDYSPTSVQGFQSYLAHRYPSIAALNAALNSDYADFAQVLPPRLDIRKDRLTRFHDHIDAYAAGIVPVTGWLHSSQKPAQGNSISIFVNGKWVARTPVQLGRQDVLAARPEFQTADLGWRYDLDFTSFPPGLYQIDIALETPGASHQHLATRTIGVIDRTQAAPPALAVQPLPPMARLNPQTQFAVDFPPNLQSVYFNPLVPIWHSYREQQVTQYLNHIAQAAQPSCLGDRLHTHQIVPFTNPGWDTTRFAINDSLRPHKGITLGISLYGEPIYGNSVLNWLRSRPQSPYAITEFHPLKAMNPQELRQALGRHQQQGAQYVSFFMEPRWHGERLGPGTNIFSLDPDNPQFSSNTLYQSFSSLLGAPPTGK